ncbi:hypothetical protein BDR03DRAFT_97220 [Suillus americanus]|nr:hypothetical protein BDR03DRAFT_97220 [Suillus americanus]
MNPPLDAAKRLHDRAILQHRDSFRSLHKQLPSGWCLPLSPEQKILEHWSELRLTQAEIKGARRQWKAHAESDIDISFRRCDGR